MYFKIFHFLNSLLNMLQYCLFHVSVFWPRSTWILAAFMGIKPTTPALEGKVLTTGPPRTISEEVILI